VERAETVLDHTTDLAATTGPHRIGDVALHLLRVAGHDDATLDHALRIGWTRLQREPANHSVRRAVRLLESVITFLGRKPHND
jgi:hypothetical protein